MHDSEPVRLVQGVGDLDAVTQELFGGQRALVQPRGEALSLEVFHDEVVAVPLAADVVKRADVGVGDLRDRLGLALEALPQVFVRSQVLGQHLDGDGPLQPRVARPVHLAHSPRADRRLDFVRTEPRTRRQCHVASCFVCLIRVAWILSLRDAAPTLSPNPVSRVP